MDVAEIVQNVLAHHGVKGMRWGVTRSKGSSPQAVSTDVKRVRGHSQVKTSGGKHQPVHEDAIKARAASQKLKASGKDTLSNKELQDLASRLDLEQRVARLSGTQGKGFVKTFLSKPQNQQKIADVAVKEGTKQVARVLAKKAAAAAVTA